MRKSGPRRYEEREVHQSRRIRVLRIFGVNFFLTGLLLTIFSGCMQMNVGKPDGPWHEAYQPMDDPEADAFIAEALGLAVEHYGEPTVPVKKVMLRRSKKTREARRYRIAEDFSLTECVDPTNGVFVIYLAVDPGHRNYYPLLGHECTHLLNPDIFDWYMEGFASAFSEQICEKTGREWGDWKHYFENTRREPYGLSYRMMLELREAFPDEYPLIIRHTAENGGDKGRLHIDIDGWIASLSPDRRAEAVEIIDAYADALERKASEQYYFKPPAFEP